MSVHAYRKSPWFFAPGDDVLSPETTNDLFQLPKSWIFTIYGEEKIQNLWIFIVGPIASSWVDYGPPIHQHLRHLWRVWRAWSWDVKPSADLQHFPSCSWNSGR